jgi:hypothetical protein
MATQSRQVSLVSRSPQLQLIPSGAGRLLTEAYLAGGRYCAQIFGRLAYRWELGPDAVAKQIWEQVEKEGSLSELIDLDQKAARELEEKCRKLMEYTLPCAFLCSSCFDEADLFPRKETISAQLRAFKNIVHLMTRVLGLRLMFLTSKHIRESGDLRTSITELWTGAEPIDDHSEWKLYLEFAASCVSDEAKLGCLVETQKLDKLISIPVESGEPSVIERLLVASDSE